MEILEREEKTLLGLCTWKKYRYQVEGTFLREARLASHPSLPTFTEIFDLRGCQTAILESSLGCFTFSLTTSKGRTAIFKCPSSSSRLRWLHILSSFQDLPSSSQASREAGGEEPGLRDQEDSLRSSSSLLSSSPSSPSLLCRTPSTQKRSLHVSETERELAPFSEVRESLPDLETFLDSVVIGTITGIIMAANGNAERLFGYGKGGLEGKPLTILMPEPYKSQHDGYLFRHERFRTEGMLGRKTQLLKGERSDGSVFPLVLSLGKLQFEGFYIATFKECL